MSLGCLAELVSVTNEAVKSTVNKSSTFGTSDKIHFFSVGSPFESPRSFQSHSNESKSNLERGKENVHFSSNVKSEEVADITNDVHIEHNAAIEGREAEDVMISEVVPCKIVNNSSYETEQPDHYIENINNNQMVSNYKKHIKEIISPREETQDHILFSSHDNVSSKGTKSLNKKDSKSFSTKLNSKGKYIVERHEPSTYNENINNNRILQGENEKESTDLSRPSDQPEIIDVQERIVTITSGMSQCSDDSYEAKHNKAQEVHRSRSNKSGSQISSGKNEPGHGLKQGALRKGLVDHTNASIFNDVYISQFGLTEKQRSLKEALAKRSENNKPKKKFVQPQIIQRKIRSDDETDGATVRSQPDSARAVTTFADPVVTAAAAASAAVAAAQPFLKTQLELETRMQQLLAQLAELQQKAGVTGVEEKSAGSENRILDLERQVAELSERRFEHLENLQQQQLQMQAQLLFMSQSRDGSSRGYPADRHMPSSRKCQASRIPQVVGKHSDIPSRSADFNPTSHRQPMYNPSTHSQSTYNPSIHSKPIFDPAVLSKHHNYLNEVRELQGSHLDTPAPRNRVPKPTPYVLPQEPQKNLGFLEELLARKDNIDQDTTYSVKGDYSSPARLESNRSNNAKDRRRDQSPVNKARQLITSLSNLEKETAESIWGSRDDLTKPDRNHLDLGPAPLDRYLKYPEKEGSPYPKLSHHSKEKKKLLNNIDNYLEAKSMLRHLEVTRETLENNIDQVVKCRRDMYVFSTLLGSGQDNATDDQLRIEKLVTKRISALEGDVQRDVTKSLAQAEADKMAAQQKSELAARQKVDLARNGTLKGQAERSARLAYSKPNVLSTAALTSKNKENKQNTVKPAPKFQATAIKDEAARVRTYGKPEYQRGRTTIRDPYLHFKNPKKGVAAKSSVTNLNESARSREGRSGSPPRKQGQEPIIDLMPRQFYFSPTRGYIPLGAGDTAPIQGQLVSMAIPLGAPRLEPGVRRSAVPVTKCSSDPVSSTPVTAARNVAMVSFPIRDDGQEHERQPELTKQVLPPIDIDSISSFSSPRSDIHIRSPQQDNANVTFLHSTRNEEDSDLNKTLTEESSDLEQSGEGIKLPGYEPKISEYSGPSFPPRTKKSDHRAVSGGEVMSAQHISDVMAEDLRRRDLLENNAVMWLEQELMARILSQVPLQISEQAVDVSKEESEGSDMDESLLVADVIGQSGMQLFIDAGQPVDNALVQQLVVEVIKEKVSAMMAQRGTEGASQTGQARVRNEVEETIEEMEKEKIASGSYRVPTPEPTPTTSPVPSPKHIKQQPPRLVTPPHSPPPEGFRFKQREPEPQELLEPNRQPLAPEPPLILTNIESESETSYSLDISEELRRVAAKDKSEELEEQVGVCRDVATPPLSPLPTADEEKAFVFSGKQATPPATPPAIKTPPRVRTPSPKEQESVSEDEVEEEEVEQPQPIMMSVGVGDDKPMTAETQTELRSSSPKRPHTPVSAMSEASSTSTESSATETVNEIISEGQWLMSYSEGQVVGAVNYEAIRKVMGKDYHHAIDVSTASTLRDTDDLDLDVEGTRSEGEFLYKFSDPEKDPRLEVLAQMQKRTPYFQQILSGPAPAVMMSNTSRSVGEISIGQVPPTRIAMEQARRYGEHGQRGRERPTRSPSPKMERSTEEDYSKDRQDSSIGSDQRHHSRTPSPQQNFFSRTQSPQQQQRSRTPPQQNRTQSLEHQQRSRTEPQPDQRSRAQPQKQQGTLGTRTRSQMQYQPVLSEGRPIATRGRNLPGQRGSHRSSDTRLSQNSDPGMRRSDSSYHSESLSRSADGETFKRTGNGFLTSSLRSGQSVVKKSVEFDLSGTQKSSRRGSRDSSDHMGDPNNSVGLTEYSLDESELRRIGGGGGGDTSLNMGPYRMSVTIPSGADGEESELSEIDLSNKSDQ